MSRPCRWIRVTPRRVNNLAVNRLRGNKFGEAMRVSSGPRAVTRAGRPARRNIGAVLAKMLQRITVARGGYLGLMVAVVGSSHRRWTVER